MLRLRVPILLLSLLALTAIGATMYAAGRSDRHVSADAAARVAASERLLTGMLDEETGLRGYLLAGEDQFLDPFRRGMADTRRAAAAIRRENAGDARVLALVDRHDALRRRWLALAREQIALRRRNTTYTGTVAQALARKSLMDAIREVNADLHARLADAGASRLRASGVRSIAVIVLLGALIALGTLLIVRREARKRHVQYAEELGYRAAQREFTDVVQVVRSEPDAHALLKRHLEIALPGARATVLTRNNSDNRLEAATPVGDDSLLAGQMAGVEPSACLAAGLGRRHAHEPGAQRLMTCQLCGAAPGRSACEPLLVGGQVIGSVLVEHGAPLSERGERALGDSVSQAAPVLANLRNLALAERRAATDVLTGLPNRRAMHDALKRMAAHASRSAQPLAAIALDLDRFKDINDRFGHDMGDTVLAHVGSLLLASVRGSDFVARVGGEEFLVLAPDTGATGAEVLAENLRAAMERERVPGLQRELTGSFGVAAIPDDTASPDALLRLADRALYEAKAAGRNRVVRAAAAAEKAV